MCRRWCGTPAPSRTRRPALSTSAPCGRPPQLDASAPSPTPAASGPTTTLSRSQRHETHRPRRKTPARRGGAQASTPERSDRPGIHRQHPTEGSMSVTTREIRASQTAAPVLVQAVEPAPGLLVYVYPEERRKPGETYLWRLGHHSGLQI